MNMLRCELDEWFGPLLDLAVGCAGIEAPIPERFERFVGFVAGGYIAVTECCFESL